MHKHGHINQLVIRALGHGCNSWNVLRAVTLNPIRHYGLSCGLLREGDSADFIVVNDFEQFDILQTYIKGQLVADNGKSLIQSAAIDIINHFDCNLKSARDFIIETDPGSGIENVKVIDAIDGQLITGTFLYPTAKLINKMNGHATLEADAENDILKVTVINRYEDVKPAVAFIKSFGFKNGAIASSVAHDSHNIIATGTSDELLARAVNLIIKYKGGLAAVTESEEIILPLPIAGIMSGANVYTVAAEYTRINEKVKQMGSLLHAPFMTLSFMALLVIPQLKLSDKGLFDGAKFEPTSLFA